MSRIENERRRRNSEPIELSQSDYLIQDRRNEFPTHNKIAVQLPIALDFLHTPHPLKTKEKKFKFRIEVLSPNFSCNNINSEPLRSIAISIRAKKNLEDDKNDRFKRFWAETLGSGSTESKNGTNDPILKKSLINNVEDKNLIDMDHVIDKKGSCLVFYDESSKNIDLKTQTSEKSFISSRLSVNDENIRKNRFSDHFESGQLKNDQILPENVINFETGWLDSISQMKVDQITDNQKINRNCARALLINAKPTGKVKENLSLHNIKDHHETQNQDKEQNLSLKNNNSIGFDRGLRFKETPMDKYKHRLPTLDQTEKSQNILKTNMTASNIRESEPYSKVQSSDEMMATNSLKQTFYNMKLKSKKHWNEVEKNCKISPQKEFHQVFKS